jgi:hypothetical protein
VFSDLEAVRVVAEPRVLDTLPVDAATRCLRLAPDDVLILAAARPAGVGGDALVEAETGFQGAWFVDRAALQARCAFPIPTRGVASGALCGIGVRMLVEDAQILVIVEAPLADELDQRLAGGAAAHE